jgi:hypothetical protein
MPVECALAVSSKHLQDEREASNDVLPYRRRCTCRCSNRISPHQGCLEIAVMLQESPRFGRMATRARRSTLAIVFFDRLAALICLFAIGAYKPV